MDPEEYQRLVADTVDQHGVFIQAVLGGPDLPFAYTVGLFAVGHPEFIVFGLPHGLAGALLNDLARSVLRSGMRFSGGDRIHGLIKNGYGQLLAVSNPEDYLLVAYELREHRGGAEEGTALPALQLVFADRDGAWPWEPASQDAGAPLLGWPPAAGEGEDQTLPDPSAS